MSIFTDIKRQSRQLSLRQLEKLQGHLAGLVTKQEYQAELRQDFPHLRKDWTKEIQRHLAKPEANRENTLRLFFLDNFMNPGRSYGEADLMANSRYTAFLAKIKRKHNCTGVFETVEMYTRGSYGDGYYAITLLLTWPT